MKLLADLWPFIAAVLSFSLTVITTIHAILNKEDTGAAVAWVGVIWIAPVVGPAGYVLFGINRINRRAESRRQAMWRFEEDQARTVDITKELEKAGAPRLMPMIELGNRVSRRRILAGNRFTALANGDEAYPEMLAAIRSAERSISLTSYIFNNDKVGRQFVDALSQAYRRGVHVRVMIDAAGTRYSFPAPTIMHSLREAGITATRFMPTWLPWRMPYMNLRSHRKILVVDGKEGFTGGMNISRANCIRENPPNPVQDLHFRVEGPVVRQLQEVFVEDWAFTTGESLEGDLWFPALKPAGRSLARGVDDGPDETFDRLRQTVFGAITCAHRCVTIATPYFLPSNSITSALITAAMRGVAVDIIMPAKNNFPFVQWASMAQLEPLLRWGCRAWLTPPPFDHTKLMVVDDGWTFLGSANWDPRSFSLNFEFNIECYDEAFAAQSQRFLKSKRSAAREVRLDDIRDRPMPIKLRDGVMRLFSPYL